MLKILTFNLRYNDDGDGNSVAERAPRVEAVIAPYRPDLMGFQEATPRWMALLTQDYGGEYDYFSKCRDEDAREAAPIFWRRDRFRCLDRGYFWLSDTPDQCSMGYDSWGCYRICTWVTLEDLAEGGSFTYFNTHFGFGDWEQMRSVELVLARMKSIAEGRAIFTGDLNMHMEAPAYRALREALVDVNMATMKDLRPTYHNYEPDRSDPESHIDYCFVTGETFRPRDSRRVDGLVDGKFPSDHYGVYSEIEALR